MSKAKELQEKFKKMNEGFERPSSDWGIIYDLNKSRVGKLQLDQNKREIQDFYVVGADSETVTVAGNYDGTRSIQIIAKKGYRLHNVVNPQLVAKAFK